MTQDLPHWKMIYLARRNPQLAAADFPQAWREHSALGRECRNVQTRVRSVTQCARLLDDPWPRDISQGYDGVNLLELSDRASADAIWNDPETLAVMRPDEPRVFDRYVRDFSLVAREQPVTKPHTATLGNALLLGFFKRRPEVAPADFEHAFHQPVQPWPALCATRLNWVEPERPIGYDYDLVQEWWFANVASMRQALGTQQLSPQLPAAYAQLCDLANAVLLTTYVSHRRP